MRSIFAPAGEFGVFVPYRCILLWCVHALLVILFGGLSMFYLSIFRIINPAVEVLGFVYALQVIFF